MKQLKTMFENDGGATRDCVGAPDGVRFADTSAGGADGFYIAPRIEKSTLITRWLRPIVAKMPRKRKR